MEPVKATETIVPAIAPEEKVVAAPEDAEARFAQLEAEKENYRKAYLKEAEKNRKPREENLDDEDKMEEVARRVLADSRLAEIAREQDEIIKKALKENKELKLAHLNKDTPAAVIGTHSETILVRDTVITPEQLASFKARGWDDKKIEAYKKNYLRNSSR